jgi:hypothetical protein
MKVIQGEITSQELLKKHSYQLAIEGLFSGGRPYLASHPELGVELGIFNDVNEPTPELRILAIKKLGVNGNPALANLAKKHGIENPLPMYWFAAAVAWAKNAATSAKNFIVDKFNDVMVIFGKPTTNYYVTWGYFESFIVTAGLSPIGKDYNNKATGTSPLIDKKDDFSSKLWYLDSTGSKMRNIDSSYFGSANPHVCLIPGRFHWKAGSSLYTWSAADAGIENSTGCESIGAFSGDFTEILINVNHIWSCYQQSETIADFIIAVAGGINAVCGGHWDIRLIESPLQANRMMIVDYSNSNAGEPNSGKVPKLKMKGVARSWGISTDIPDSLRHSMLMQSKKKANTAATENDAQVTHLYSKEIKDTLVYDVELSPKCPSDLKSAYGNCNDKEEKEAKVTKDYLKENWNAMKEMADNVSTDSIDTAIIANKQYLNMWLQESPQANEAELVIPVGFKATLDGMSGLTWGQSFEVEEVNDAGILPKGHYWRITDTNQSISQADWTSDIQTQLMQQRDLGATPAPKTSSVSVATPPTATVAEVEEVEEVVEDCPKCPDGTTAKKDANGDCKCEEECENKIKEAYKNMGYVWDENFNFFGVRRLTKDGKSTNQFTDSLCLWVKDDTDCGILHVWTGTTTPGKSQGSSTVEYIATVVPDQYLNTYAFTWMHTDKNIGVGGKANKSWGMMPNDDHVLATYRKNNMSYDTEKQTRTKKSASYFIHGTWNAKWDRPNWLPPPSNPPDNRGLTLLKQEKAAGHDKVSTKGKKSNKEIQDSWNLGILYNNKPGGKFESFENISNESQGCQVFKYVKESFAFLDLLTEYYTVHPEEIEKKLTYTLFREYELAQAGVTDTKLVVNDDSTIYKGTADRKQ